MASEYGINICPLQYGVFVSFSALVTVSFRKMLLAPQCPGIMLSFSVTTVRLLSSR